MCHMYTPLTKHTFSYSLPVCVSLSLSFCMCGEAHRAGVPLSLKETALTSMTFFSCLARATSYASPWESTGSIDRRAVAKSWTGFLQSGSQALATMSARKSSSKYLRICSDTLEITKTTLKKVQIKNKHAEKVCLSTSLFSICEQNSCKLQLG